ncbi:hypothetical protein SEPCBS119000_002571 [Sporothrix epigloea]|uniref:Integral membrane protein n=1 Tax=Sporothrix epigloea TaxID=1892477 RepID=A0ABP0DKZ4_9PEZI
MKESPAENDIELRSLPHKTRQHTPRSNLDTSYSQDNNTVIIERPDEYGGPLRPEFPEFAHFCSNSRPIRRDIASPVPPSIDAVLWQTDCSAAGVNNDGNQIESPDPHGPTNFTRGVFTPWTGSTSGARAWIHADELEAVTPPQGEIWLATRFRRYLIVICCALYLVATILLIVAQTGSTSKSRPSTDIFLYRFNLSVLFDNSYGSAANVSDSALSSAKTESLGLHNYYQVGLWGYCVGDSASAFSSCSRPQAFYWFDPVAILLSEMLNTSSLTLPVRVQTVLDILRVVSKIMFGTCFVGVILAGVLVFATPLLLLTRWMSVPVGLLAAVTALCLFVGSGLAMTMALAYRLAGSVINQINILVTVGDTMFGLVWAATTLSFIGLILHAILCFCGPSVRDIRTGRRTIGQLMEFHVSKKRPAARPNIIDSLQDKSGMQT